MNDAHILITFLHFHIFIYIYFQYYLNFFFQNEKVNYEKYKLF